MQFGPTHITGGGASVAVKQLSSALVSFGYEVMLIGNSGEGIDKLVEIGVNYQQVKWSRKIPKLLGCVRQVRHYLKVFKPHIVHVHGRAPSLMCILAGRKPDFFTLHNSVFVDQVGALDLGFVRKYFSPLAHRIIALNPKAVEYVTTKLGVKPKDVEFITNGTDCDHFRPPTEVEREEARMRFGVGENEIMAVFLGNFIERKQPDAVVALAAAARDVGLKALRFALFGMGSLKEVLQERIHTLDLEDVCQLHNWVDNPRLAYWSADILLLPSLEEGFALVTVEALACGCPVLGTRTGGWEFTIREGITGFSCEIDRDSFITKGLEVLGNRESLQQMRPAARAWAEKQLSIQQQIKRTTDAYYLFLAERKGSKS